MRHNAVVLECVVNVSEGSDQQILSELSTSCNESLLDVHSDAHHNRSVFTLAGNDVTQSVRALTREAVRLLDINQHIGVHPRLGVVDVVPFVPLVGSTPEDAIAARNSFAKWLANELHVPAFIYGDERSLPDVRRHAFKSLTPDCGPQKPHPTAGATAVGARPFLIAYNLWLQDDDLGHAKEIASAVRTRGLRTLALQVGNNVQVSCNLIEPDYLGPDVAWDAVAAHTEIARAELVGLIPEASLNRIDHTRWTQLDIGVDRTIEARLRKNKPS